MPKEKRPGLGRWPLLVELPLIGSGGGEAHDWPHLSPTPEINWFRSAFATELGQLEAIFGKPPDWRWGLVWWLY
jgi:hypothetical protein